MNSGTLSILVTLMTGGALSVLVNLMTYDSFSDLDDSGDQCFLSSIGDWWQPTSIGDSGD